MDHDFVFFFRLYTSTIMMVVFVEPFFFELNLVVGRFLVRFLVDGSTMTMTK